MKYKIDKDKIMIKKYSIEKTYVKRIFIYILTLIITFVSVTSVYYSVPVSAGILDLYTWTYDKLKDLGFLFDNSRLHPTPLEMAEAINQNDQNANVQANEESINSYLEQNITETDNSITYNNNSKYFLNWYANQIMSQSGFYYAYSYNILNSLNQIQDGVRYNALRKFLIEHQNDGICFFENINYYGVNDFIFVYDDNNIGFVRSGTTNDQITNVVAIDKSTWQSITFSIDNCTVYGWTNPDEDYVELDSFPLAAGAIMLAMNDSQSLIYFGYLNAVNINGYRLYKVFYTLEDLKAEQQGISPYYISDKWNNFVNSNNTTYTVDSSNSNNVTYGDTNNWINNYYTDNGTYPDPTQITIYIDNNIPVPNPTPTPTPVPDDPGGGGSGGSGSDANIFDFLSDLGAVLGNLIKNLGKAITDIIEGISEVITGLMESIPVVFNDFLGALIGWLPPELRLLISLTISAMVLVGLIHLFKG